jgi:uncharacterized protein YcbK (DUF882 family)
VNRLGVILGVIALFGTTQTTGADAVLPRGERRLEKKPCGSGTFTGTGKCTGAEEPGGVRPFLGTMFQTHTGEAVIVDGASPSDARFSAMLADRVTGQSIDLDPRLVALLRHVLEKHTGARIELVSGYRSKKLNEMMRKKGHHVASHSQHSLGHAVDFRIVLPGETKGIDPRTLERELRGLGWDGGVGIYTLESDWFVHADVGPRRGWNG